MADDPPRGDVIEALNEALHEELTAINQYFLHAEMCDNWHYDRLAYFIKKQSIGEMKHAEILIERILFLDGTPNLTKPMELTVGRNVKEQIESDLKLEIDAVAMYNRSVETARHEGDSASRELFARLLKDEEEHVDFLEAQVHQMKEMGYERISASSRSVKESERLCSRGKPVVDVQNAPPGSSVAAPWAITSNLQVSYRDLESGVD